MGIPYFYRSIIDKYPKLILDKSPNQIDNLYFDLNSLIHPVSARYYKQPPFPEDNVVFMGIIDEILKLIKYTNPSKGVFIAIDGVAPMAKIYQQRQRRFKSMLYNKMINKKWDSNQISPGTDWMNRLDAYLQQHLVKSLPSHLEIIYSSANVVGEGEHKIFQYMRENVDINSYNVIHGLDADLILLSFLNPFNVLLLRETMNFGQKLEGTQEYHYLDVINLKKYFIGEMKGNHFSEQILIQDYTLMTFLIGNDFVPKCSFIHIENEFFEDILDIYYDLALPLTTTSKEIDIANFGTFLSRCFQIEDGLYTQAIDHYEKKRYIERETEPKKILEGQINRLPLYKKERCPFPDINTWRDDYYKYYEYELDKSDIMEMCNTWINTIIWNFDYYFNSCKDYHYYYPYNCSPTLRDIVQFLKEDSITDIIHENPPLKTEEQLTLILPYTSHCFLKESSRVLIDKYLGDFYPSKFRVLMWGKTYYHESIPILPKLDIMRYIKVWKKMDIIDNSSIITLRQGN